MTAYLDTIGCTSAHVMQEDFAEPLAEMAGKLGFKLRPSYLAVKERLWCTGEDANLQPAVKSRNATWLVLHPHFLASCIAVFHGVWEVLFLKLGIKRFFGRCC
jgi:hypothetical protein